MSFSKKKKSLLCLFGKGVGENLFKRRWWSLKTVEILEAMAARRAMIFMEELGLRRAIFEGDSETVVKALSGDCPDRSCIGHIVKDYKSLMGCFQTNSFSHVRRQSNGVAHTLARRARKSSPLSVWMESIPPDISYLVYVDVTT